MTTLICDYVQLNDLKAHLRIPTANTDDDAELGMVITAASRAIDSTCNRKFGLAPSVALRIYTWGGELMDGRPALPVDDFQTSTGLIVAADYALDFTYSTTLTLGTDFDLYPWNAAGDVQPWTHLVMRAGQTNDKFPVEATGVKVTAQYGWTAIPSLVEVACLIQSSRWFMRRDSWAGVAGSPEVGSEVRLLANLDPDVQAALQPMVRYWGAA